jgi:hypothetical protein
LERRQRRKPQQHRDQALSAGRSRQQVAHAVNAAGLRLVMSTPSRAPL